MARPTERLYQSDSFLRRFQATVVDVLPAAGSPEPAGRFDLLLDRTAFYPTGGGQPFDTGLIGGCPVVDVREGERGPVHSIDVGPERAPRPGARIECEVDWGRRFDHMQQHSGQHLLSRALIASASARTRSFHLGERLCTIDVEMAPPEAGAIRTAESATNGLIWEDRPVTIREAPPEAGADPAAAAEATALAGLKLKPGDPVRTIVVEGFDATPCGGTHVARTGQVGAVAVTGWEPCRGLTRITFVCGGRVVRRLHETVATVDACVEGLSAPEPEVAGALRRLLAERERLGRHARALEAQMALQEAAREALSAPSIGGWSVLRRGWRIEEKSIDAAQLLARSFVAGPSRLALLAVIDGGRATVIAARSPGAGPAVGPALAEAARLMGGRGGGSAEQGRAGGLPAGSVDALLDELLARLAPADGEAAG